MKELIDAAVAINPLVDTDEFAHMRKPWEMVLGGLLLPALVKDDPEFLKANPEYQELLDRYTKEKVEAFLKTGPVIVEVPGETVEVEKIVTKTVKVPVPVAGAKGAPKTPLHEPCKDGGKCRRLKDDGVDKKSRKKRGFDSADRDIIITWWNDNQKMVDKEDPVCQTIADKINAVKSADDKVSALQIAGYFSRLATWGRMVDADREAMFDRSMKRGSYTVRPEYSPDLLKAIEENYLKEREDERIRKAAHAKMRAEVAAAGPRITPVSSEETEEDEGTLEPETVEEPEAATAEADSDDCEITFA